MNAAEQDRADPLAGFIEEFVPHGGDVLAYLDGNSLGRPPKATEAALVELVRGQWGDRLIRSWSEGWMDWPVQLGDRLGRAALGAADGQVIVGDSTTVCLYKLVRAAVALRPGRTELVTDVHNFPTDRYVVEGIAGELGLRVRWLETDPARGPEPAGLAPLVGADTAAVVLSHVAYRSAFISDLAAITELAHEAGALAVWDLCHSAGVLPVALDAAGADFAVGCTYKFLCGGPGAPAFMYVAAEHQQRFRQPVQGWIGRAEPFAMAPGYEPAGGMRRALSGTPPITALVGVREGLRLIERAGIDRIRDKSMRLTAFAVELADAIGTDIGTPRDPALRGGHVTLRHPQARELSSRLVEAGVLVDFREPDGIRIGLSPLSTTFGEVERAMRVLERMLPAGASQRCSASAFEA